MRPRLSRRLDDDRPPLDAHIDFAFEATSSDQGPRQDEEEKLRRP